jgi:hypothetical protein
VCDECGLPEAQG